LTATFIPLSLIKHLIRAFLISFQSQQKPGGLNGDGFVGWLFGLPPSDDTGHGSSSLSSQARGVASEKSEKYNGSSKAITTALEQPIPRLSYTPDMQHHQLVQSGRAL